MMPTVEQRRALRWEKARRRLALAARLHNHPRRLSARWLHLATGARKAMARDLDPGRDWWRRQWRDCMGKAHVTLPKSPA